MTGAPHSKMAGVLSSTTRQILFQDYRLPLWNQRAQVETLMISRRMWTSSAANLRCFHARNEPTYAYCAESTSAHSPARYCARQWLSCIGSLTWPSACWTRRVSAIWRLTSFWTVMLRVALSWHQRRSLSSLSYKIFSSRVRDAWLTPSFASYSFRTSHWLARILSSINRLELLSILSPKMKNKNSSLSKQSSRGYRSSTNRSVWKSHATLHQLTKHSSPWTKIMMVGSNLVILSVHTVPIST